MDYRALLVKYMAHVIEEEGINLLDFDEDGDMYGTGWHGTKEDAKELQAISEEACTLLSHTPRTR